MLLHHVVASADGAASVRLSLYAKAEVDPRCGTGLCLATDGATLLVGLEAAHDGIHRTLQLLAAERRPAAV